MYICVYALAVNGFRKNNNKTKILKFEKRGTYVNVFMRTVTSSWKTLMLSSIVLGVYFFT